MQNLRRFGETLVIDLDTILSMQYFRKDPLNIDAYVVIMLEAQHENARIVVTDREAINDLCNYIEAQLPTNQAKKAIDPQPLPHVVWHLTTYERCV